MENIAVPRARPVQRASSVMPTEKEVPAWVGNVVGDEQTYAVRAFQKQGKSGPYLSLYFESAEPTSD